MSNDNPTIPDDLNNPHTTPQDNIQTRVDAMVERIQSFQYIVGDTLRNGATLLATRTNERGDTYVLCLYGREYATWYLAINGGTLTGHYHEQDLQQALNDLATR